MLEPLQLAGDINYELKLVIYLICCLGDLLPRERSVTLEPLQLAGDINYEFLLVINLICCLVDLLPGSGHGGRTSPTSDDFNYEHLLVIYLICCLGDLLPREQCVALVSL